MIFSLGLAGAFALFHLGRATVDSSALARSTDAHEVYYLGLRALSKDVSDSDVLAPLTGTPFELDEREVMTLLVSTFDETELMDKAERVHRRLIAWGTRRYDSLPSFRIGIEDERARLAHLVSGHLIRTYESLPDCGIIGDVDALLSGMEKKLGWADDEEALRDMPDCHPTGIVAGPVKESLGTEIVRRVAEHDSVEVFPQGDWTQEEFRSWVSLGRRLVQWPWALGLAGMAFGVCFMGYEMNRGRRWLVFRLLVLTGSTLLVLSVVLAFLPAPASLFETAFGRPLNPTVSVKDAWIALVLAFEQAAWRIAALRSAVTGCGILLVALILRNRLRPNYAQTASAERGAVAWP
ncbi:MAG: hypothetical protein HKN73_12735 [Gemmatimonadetes bacterium]|nr:hypothetical protein [Gemmatimonadota bacterium]